MSTARQCARAAACGLLGATMLVGGAHAAVRGSVFSEGGQAIEGALVEATDGSDVTVTGPDGEFELTDARHPVTVRITHPRFEDLEVEAGPEPLTVSLVPKQQVFEEVVVAVRRDPGARLEPVSSAVSTVQADEAAGEPESVVALAERTPGVAMSGQGGLFQAYSIRGIAGQRVRTSVAGVRIVTERRAGATASFVDPTLLQGLEVIRGPASTYYDSGALGGVLEVEPAVYDGVSFVGGYSSEGDERFARYGWGGGSWSLGLATRRADDGETPDGERLFSRFEQTSAVVRGNWRPREDLDVTVVVMPSLGRDIGKPNTRFPETVTIYPEEYHVVTRVAVHRRDGWAFDLVAHPNGLETRETTADERAFVDNDAFDFGLSARRRYAPGDGWTVFTGAEYFGRQGVEATERVDDLTTGASETFTTLDGAEHEASAYASARRAFGRANVEAGGRYTWIEQSNAGLATAEDSAFTGFVGVTVPIGGGYELAGNVGSGLRFPGLSERFFSGTTGRGDVVANPALEPERSLAVDVGLRYYGTRLYVAAYAFRNEIDDYIDRVEIEPGVRTFVNLTSGTIEGFELDGRWTVSPAWSLQLVGVTSEGRSDRDEPLADIPADRVALGAHWSEGAWRIASRLEHRFAKTDPAGGEVRTGAADLLSLTARHRWDNGFGVGVFGRNLLDETYLPSPDDRSVPAPGLSIGVELGWTAGGGG